MKLKAVVAAGLSALALSGVLASSAGASVPMTPSPQEMAAHPGMGYTVRCQISEAESRDINHIREHLAQANAEGKCTAKWEVEAPLPTGPSASASKRQHRRHHRARRHH